MSRPNELPWLITGFVFCFIVGGMHVWPGSYVEYLDGGVIWPYFASLTAVAFVATSIGNSRLLISALVIGASFPAVIIVRIIVDCAQNPTHHNLWPIEVIAASVMGTVLSTPGSAFGWLLRRLVFRAPRTEES